MQLLFVTYRKKFEGVDFVDEEFLHKKINKKKHLYVVYDELQKIFQKMHVVKAAYLSQALWWFYSIIKLK